MISKDHIIKIASDLFLRYGVKTVTLERIAQELHTSKRTIYLHFADKTALLSACLASYFAEARAKNQREIAEAKNAIEAVGMINVHIMNRATAVNPSFFRDVEHYYAGMLKDVYKETGSYAHSDFIKLAKWGIEDGIFLADMDIDVAAKTVMALFTVMQDLTRFPPGEYGKQRLTFGIMLPYLRGMCTEKGCGLLENSKHLFYLNV